MRAGWSYAIAIATVASAAEARGETRPGTRWWILDATIGPRSGEASGMNAKVSAAWTVLDNLGGRDPDRSWYLSVGGLVARGELRADRADPEAAARTWSIAPELRTGVAWGHRDELYAHLYLSASVGFMQWHRPTGTFHDPLAVRLAAGMSFPTFRRQTPAIAASIVSGPGEGPHDPDESGARAAFYAAPITVPAAIMALFMPDTLEVTLERAHGYEFVGVAAGYSL